MLVSIIAATTASIATGFWLGVGFALGAAAVAHVLTKISEMKK